MKRVLIFVLAIAMTSVAFAKDIGLRVDFGGQYVNHQLHDFHKDKHDGFDLHTITSKHMGGFNLGIDYLVADNWSIYFKTAFSFNNVFVNDTVFGFGYNFNVADSFYVFLGGGLALGGSKFSNTIAGVTTSVDYFNLGAGIEVLGVWMFTDMVGMYFGVTDNYYGVLSGKVTTHIEATNTKTTAKIHKDLLPDMAKSVGGKLGIRLAF